MKNMILTALFGTAVIINAACTGTEPAANTTAANSTAKTNTAAPANAVAAPTNTAAPANTTTGANTAKADNDEVPALVTAVFPDAQSVTTQHKDLTEEQIKEIKEEMKVTAVEAEHHSYLAFKTEGGTRKQTGAATVVNASGKDFVVIYENKAGEPVIKEVRSDGVPAAFLTQFAGKSHDNDKLELGADLKANGAEDKLAKAATDAIRVDAMIMALLYGTGHKH